MKSRLDKEIKGLNDTFLRYNLENRFHFDNDILVIKNDNYDTWKPIFLISIILLIPTTILIYYFFFDNTNPIIFSLTILIIWFGYDFYRIIRIPNILTFDFKQNFFKIKNSNKVFDRLFPYRQVYFCDIISVELKNKKIEEESNTSWKQLFLTDKNNNKILLTEFNCNFPETLIAEKVKLLFEVIIWMK